MLYLTYGVLPPPTQKNFFFSIYNNEIGQYNNCHTKTKKQKRPTLYKPEESIVHSGWDLLEFK